MATALPVRQRKQFDAPYRVYPKALAVAEFARIQTTGNRLNSGEFSYFRGMPGIIGTPTLHVFAGAARRCVDLRQQLVQ